jgi:hypothetical protein
VGQISDDLLSWAFTAADTMCFNSLQDRPFCQQQGKGQEEEGLWGCSMGQKGTGMGVKDPGNHLKPLGLYFS